MKRRNVWFWISPFIFGFLVMLTVRLVSDVPTEYKFWERPLKESNRNSLGDYHFYFIQFSQIYFINRRKATETQLTVKKLITEYLIVTLSGLLITAPCVYLIHFMTGDPVYTDDLDCGGCNYIVFGDSLFHIQRGDVLQAYVNQKTLTQQIKNMQMETELNF